MNMGIFLCFFSFYSEHIEQETKKRMLKTEEKIGKLSSFVFSTHSDLN
jgi:hypothetical protein